MRTRALLDTIRPTSPTMKRDIIISLNIRMQEMHQKLLDINNIKTKKKYVM